jgi:subtilisin family serine protease
MTFTLFQRRPALAITGIGAAACLGVAVALVGTADASTGATGAIRLAGSPNAIRGSYIVVLKDSAGVSAQGLTARHGGAVKKTWNTALKGFELSASAATARRYLRDPQVAYVEANQTMRISDTQDNPPSYGLDRVDQRDLPLDGSYTFPTAADNVSAFIIDTGIQFDHKEFGGRARPGTDTVGDGRGGADCNGHGTHVAGTVGGKSFGLAKGVNLIAVRVLDCQGGGTSASVIEGIDWVTRNAKGPSVANMSLGGGADDALDEAVQRSIDAGVTYALAAGNESQDACNTSPARVPAAITVGATDRTDARADFSNFGTCVDIFAPGVDIKSSFAGDRNDATATLSGTSMATPHVTGAAALIVAGSPDLTPKQVRDQMVKAATAGKVNDPGAGSPNRLLFVGD